VSSLLQGIPLDFDVYEFQAKYAILPEEYANYLK